MKNKWNLNFKFLYKATQTLCHCNNRTLPEVSATTIKLDSEKEKRGAQKRALSFEEYCARADAMRLKLETKCAAFPLALYEHFAKIKNDIDIKRETLLEQVNCGNEERLRTRLILDRGKFVEDLHRTSADMIEQVEQVEERSQQAFHCVRQRIIDDFVQSQHEMEENRDADVDYELMLNSLERKLSRFQLVEYDLLRNKFTPYTYHLIATFDSKSFGRLDVHDGEYMKMFNFIDHDDDNDFIYKDDDDIQNVATSFTRLHEQNEIQIVNLNTSAVVKELEGHLGVVFCLVAYGEKKLISGSKDKSIKIWVSEIKHFRI